ncbi:DUF5908 family protein [Chitinophaga sancti]|uniref:DUF5908 family protein n=1 Tax=Chitinophaga sancti TaxID=1004 RepID=UPI002A74AD88|nr:DUF5908 family protein [Chitinophaga sancti]WPQ60893.1 DUF5908 family protein [Chitinophaga sancti]
MALEIRELVIKVTITSGQTPRQEAPDAALIRQLKDKIVKECMQQLKAGLKTSTEDR